MKYLFLLFLSSLCLLSVRGRTTVPPLTIEHIGLKDGLSNNFVTAIAQDKHGLLWVATDNGLNRFDGKSFKVYNERNNTLKGNSINALFYDDKTDYLWIGSKKGLDVLDCATQRFVDLVLPDNIQNVNIVDFCRASDGGVYIVNHYNFILHYNSESGEFSVYRAENLPGLAMAFRSIADDGHGNVYIGHANHGFSVVNFQNKKIETFVHKASDANSLPADNVRDILIDRYNNVWLGTDNGLALFNPSAKSFSTIVHNDALASNRIGPHVYSIMEASDGLLWIGCDIGGVCLFDTRDLSLSNPDRLQLTSLSAMGDGDGLSSLHVRSVFQDTYGNIWIGNHSEGLDFISRTQPLFGLLPYKSIVNGRIKDNSVWSLYTDSEDNLWAGGENEIVLFNDGQIKRKYPLPLSLNNTRRYVYAMIRLGDNLLFSSLDDGIFSLNVSSGNVTRISKPGDRNYANIFAVTPDHKVLLGMQDGLYEYVDGQIQKNEKLSSAMFNLNPNGIVVDRQGKLWVGSYGSGIFIFDGQGNQLSRLDVDNGLCSGAIKQLYLDSRGWMWVAGQDGLSVIRDTKRPQTVQNYDYASGLTDIHIHALQEDADGNMWFSTSNGLSKWSKATSQIENYDYHDGLPLSSFISRAASRSLDGNIYFGTLNGICSFNPRHFPSVEDSIPVQIIDCQSIFNPAETPSIAIDSKGERSLEVSYDMNSLRVVFSVPDYSMSRVVEYSYKVEGLDNEWVMAGREHEATLRNLSPGTYILKVRARLKNQEWDDANMATIKIVVTPPLWLTWYAKLLYLLLTVWVVYVIIRVYKHRLQLKNSLEMERLKNIDEQHLNNERLRFYTNITHELRTPLTLILGPLEDLVADSLFPKDYKKRIETIHASAMRLLNLINQILEFRKTETQNRQLSVAKGQIATLVTEIGLRYKELNHNEHVSFELNVDNNVPELYFDSDIIHTILNNLLSNAVKYTPQGSISLSLRNLATADGTHLVEIEVHDTGYGIDEKALPHIFDRYYQAEGKHQASGTGIGLALVKSLSELHEGEIEVVSKLGQGTSFKFRLDADNNYPHAIHKEETALSESASDTTPTTTESTDRLPVVLIVEDDEGICDYAEYSLRYNYTILTAINGKEGLEIARKHIPDIIISDIMMPVMDGIEMCRLIKGDIATSHIPVILLTAKDSLQDKEEGYDVGADSYMTKPFSTRLLMSRIKNILESRKALASVLTERLKASLSTAPSPVLSEPIVTSETSVLPMTTDETYAVPTLKLSKLDEMFLDKFTKTVEDNINHSQLDMTFMQNAMNMSHSTLYRKIKGLTGMSGNEFIRKIKLKRGYKLLEEGYNVSEVAYACGFNDVGYFRNCFKEEYGMSPTQFLKSNKGY